MPLQVDEGGGGAAAAADRGAGRHRAHRARRRAADRARRHGRLLATLARRHRARPRRRGVLRRRPAAGRAGPRRRPGRRRARRRRGGRGLPHVRRRICAIGECACVDGRVYGLVAPGYAMAEVRRRPAARRRGARSPAPTPSTKLKLLGVDVASFGDAFAATAWRARGRVHRPGGSAATRSWSSPTTPRPCSAASWSVTRRATPRCARWSARPLPGDPVALLAAGGPGSAPGVGALPGRRAGLLLQRRDQGAICTAIAGRGCATCAGDQGVHQAGTGCGSCVPAAEDAARRRPASTSARRCASTSTPTRAGAVRHRPGAAASRRSASWSTRHGRGRGCDICKPVVASILAASAHGAHPRRRAGARCRTPTTTSWPTCSATAPTRWSRAIPGGEITPDKLHRHRRGRPRLRPLHQDHRRAADRPVRRPAGSAARDLAAAGRRRLRVRPRLRQGAAHGEVVRRDDLVPLRRAGLGRPGDRPGAALPRAARPAQDQAGVSGCARECAEAQGKDVGVIATENGWNLYVGGNGGFRPRHAELLAADLDTGDAGPHDRPVPDVLHPHRRPAAAHRAAGSRRWTAAWTTCARSSSTTPRASAADLEAAMARHVDGYRDEWRAVLDDPERLAPVRLVRQRARTSPDPSIVFVAERGQPRPAAVAETAALVAGPRLPVGAP